ncbi:MAG: phosphoglycolate phosphatase [Gammaproteobacteria bacterium]|nr:phosphoglycolate phosphatase [Gammaproteobacteria bacterium]MCP5201180.1 phosphoglycolate phosphatase [Gammaproteobacteria bacterium]
MTAPPRAVLFDLDGTLLDTAPDLARALNRVRVDDGLAPLPFATIRPHVSHGSTALIALGFDLEPGTPAFENRRQRLLDAYHAEVAVESRLFPGMHEVLATLEARGLAWGIVTNKPGWLTAPLLAALALDRRAACVVSGDTTPRAKPHPDPLLAAAAAIGLPSAACLYVGDAERDVAAARAAGMAVLVALYGYLAPGDEPARWGATACIEQAADILAWL